ADHHPAARGAGRRTAGERPRRRQAPRRRARRHAGHRDSRLLAMRLDVLLGRNAGWSRTAARAVIAGGRVRIAGQVVEDPRRDLPADTLPFTVAVDDARLSLYDRVSLMLNKPTGCVTALPDPQHPTAYALLRSAPLHGELRSAGWTSTPRGSCSGPPTARRSSGSRTPSAPCPAPTRRRWRGRSRRRRRSWCS